MAVSVGTRIGVYEIVAAIGSGGMGEVYRAHDTKLSRDIALKILPEAFALIPIASRASNEKRSSSPL